MTAAAQSSVPARVASPDGRRVLVWQKQDDYDYSLHLSDLDTQETREVLRGSQTGTIAWSPDGAWFFVNVHKSSDWDNAYIYNTATLHRLDLARLIAAHDATVRRYRAVGSHMYTVAEKWVDTRTVQVDVSGHTDSPAHGSSIKFLFSLLSSITKIR